LIRPLTPADREAVRRGYQETSSRTRYLRFLGAVGELSEQVLTYLTDVDQDRHVALVAVVSSPDLKEERGVGVARFVRLDNDPECAEAAITVIDDMQRRGVGTALARELERAARALGVRRFRAHVLDDNAMMRSILEGAGTRCHPRGHEDSTLSYDIDLEPLRAETRSARLLEILRGAAETMALKFRRWWPETEGSGAATADAREHQRGEREGEAETGAGRPHRRS
jgi:GNAT superfamily N-acetyltransferase